MFDFVTTYKCKRRGFKSIKLFVMRYSLFLIVAFGLFLGCLWLKSLEPVVGTKKISLPNKHKLSIQIDKYSSIQSSINDLRYAKRSEKVQIVRPAVSTIFTHNKDTVLVKALK